MSNKYKIDQDKKLIKFFVSILCCFIPFNKFRKNLKNYLLSDCLKNNKIYLVKPDGTKLKVKKIKGIYIKFIRNGNHIEIHEPFNFKGCKIICIENMNIIIESTKHRIHGLDISGWNCRNSNIKIGKNLFGNPVKLKSFPNGDILIGDDCMLGYGCEIRTSDEHLIYEKENLKPNREKINQSVVLKNHVWIGSGALILKGCIIPENSVIGANAVVANKKYEKSNIVIAGNPAKIVKENIIWEV